MNNPLSDGNESTIDIFVLSNSTTESAVQAGHLEQMGYRITLFTDGKQLLESLRTGKPNLLICDTVALQEDAYDLCRLIKADNDLWVVPVLIVTEASNLADLLHVLDCNADNFISYPYDPSYLTALVEGMLSTPVERQTPEQIKTQFKIQHDEHVFVVTADRRKLLEFLLSSFEIAVNRSGDISRVQRENENLSGFLKQSEELTRDQARSIEILNGTLQQKEQMISTLVANARDKDQQISENTEEIQQLKTELESGKSLLSTTEEQLRSLTREAEDLASRYTVETGDLKQQLSSMAENLASLKTEILAAKDSLAIETTQRADAEARLADTMVQKEQAEKSVRALTLDCEQMRVSLAAEKNRAQSVEYEIKSLLQAKTESEQELTRIISELKDTAKQQAADISRQNKELDNGKNYSISLEIQLANLKAEKERAETEMRASADSYVKNQGDLQATLDRTRVSLEEQEHENESLKTSIREIQDARDKTTRDLQVLSDELSTLRTSLADERDQHRTAEENLKQELRERDALLQSLHGEHQSVQTDLDDHKSTLTRVNADLESAIATRSALESSLDTAAARIGELESELHTASATGSQAGQQVRALTDELEHVKAELENNRRQRHGIEESLAGEKLEKERISSDLQNLSRERDSLQSILAKEQQLRSESESERERLRLLLTSAETEGKDQETALSATIRKLTSELESSQTLRRELEEQIALLAREKHLAEEKSSNLSAEIDQARTALADEWEDHMNAQERLVAAVNEKQQLEQSLQQSGDLGSDKSKKRALIVKGPDFPMDVGKRPQSLTAVPAAPPSASPEPRITNVEDLFEEDDGHKDVEPGDMPSVSIIHEASVDGGDDNKPVDTDTEFSTTLSDSENEQDDPDDDEGTDGEIASEDGQSLSASGSGDGTPQGIAFNRAQWFDLLKWAHHSGTLSQEQRMQIVRMGRLIQKGRKLTHKQEEQVKEMITLVQAQGYRFT
ncbi:MAG: response regulator [Methanoregula sp.]|jgi:DNA-binding response OmpR family regulator|uniref:response regulator n=1 Tax=Methanoregula sp. TaxID=2052170 RepID=UPI003C138DF1